MLETSYNNTTNDSLGVIITHNVGDHLIVKMYYFEQSAGNQLIYNKYILVGSSETIRNLHNIFIITINLIMDIMKRYSPLNNYM